jgi:hypothetical protein
MLPSRLIWDIGRDDLSVQRVGILTDNVQVQTRAFRYCDAATDKHTLVVWILFDDSSVEDSFDDVLTLKAFFQSVVHRVAFDEIVSRLYPCADELDVHPRMTFVCAVIRKSLFAPTELL